MPVLMLIIFDMASFPIPFLLFGMPVPSYLPPYLPPFLSFPLFLTIKAIFPLIFLIFYLILLPVLLLLNVKRVYKVLLAVAILPMLCISGLVARRPTEILLDSVQVGSNRYNLTNVNFRDDKYDFNLLYKCNFDNFECEKIQDYISTYSYYSDVEKSKLVVDSKTQEVHVLIQEHNTVRMEYTYGNLSNQSRAYDDKLELSGYDYYLAAYYEAGGISDYDNFHYTLYRCTQSDLNCTQLPFRYDRWEYAIYMKRDLQTHGIRVLAGRDGAEELIYIYSDVPKCYVQACFLTDK
jgi:hypothetical protein